MATLRGISGASLVADPFGAFQLGQSRTIQLQQQRQQLAAAQAQAAQQQQLQGLLGQITPGQQPVPQLGATAPVVQPQAVPQQLGVQPAVAPQAVPTAQPQIVRPQAINTQALAQLAVQFPEQFEQVNQNLGLITQQQKNEAADFAFRLRNTPVQNRDALIQQRISTLQAQGRNAADTAQLIGLPEQAQNEALDTVQIAALSPEQRIDIAREGPAALQNIVEAAGGGFIGIDPTRRESVFIPPPVVGIKTQKQVDAERKAQEKRVIEDVKASDNTFDRAKKLRSEITKVSSDFNKISAANSRIEAVSKDPSAAGDLALIFNFMKMLDPGSVVRESEFATAQNSAGVPDRIRNQYNRALTGERLAPKQRQDFLDQSQKIFIRSQKDNDKAINKIVDIGQQFGVSRDQLLGREQPTTTQVGRFTVEAE